MTAAADWSRALEVQLELIRWFRDDRVGWICARDLMTAGAGDVDGRWYDHVHELLIEGTAAADLEIDRLAQEARPVGENVATILDASATYWVSPDMGRFLTYAQQDMPAHDFRPEDLPTPAGFVYFAEPLEFDTGHPSPHRVALLAWAVFDGNAIISTYAKVDQPPRFWPLSCASGPIAAGPTETLDRLAQAFWVLSQQRLVSTDERPVERHARKRMARVGLTVPEDGIRVVTLRRPEQRAASADRLVDWSHRWIVSGHWRNQWYPATDEHRPKWIEAYPKGPDNKPLVLKDRVYRWVR